MASTKMWRTLKRALATLLVMIMISAIGTSVYAQHYEHERQTDLQVKAFLTEHTSKYFAARLGRKNVTGLRETARRTHGSSGSSRLEGMDEIVLQMADGSETAYVFSEEVKFVDGNNELQYKDSSIVAQSDAALVAAGYEYTNGPNDYRLDFSANPTLGVHINDHQNQITIAPVPASENIVGVKTDTQVDGKDVDVFEYHGVFGADTLLRYTPQLNTLRKDIVLSSYQGQNSFDFLLYTHGNVAQVAEDKSLQIKNPISGNVVSAFQPVFAYDAFGGEYSQDAAHYTENCAYELTELGDSQYKLTIAVDPAFLAGENTVYPVTIDPVTAEIGDSIDLPVYSQYPNDTFGGNTTNCFGKTSSSEYGNGRVYAKFAVPTAITIGATINSAEYFVRETTGRTTTTYVRPYIVTGGNPASTTTWNNKPAYDANSGMTRRNINSASTDVSGSPYWYKFELKTAVKKWVDGTAPNYGIVFVSEEESATTYNWRALAAKEHSTASYRPYIVINYTNDTTAPTLTDVTGNPTAWTNANVTLKVTGAADSAAGLHASPYSFSTTSGSYSWQASATSPAYTANTTVYVSLRDKAGNIATRKTVTINKIDKTVPTTPTVTGNPSAWTNANVTLTAASTDAASGIAGYSFDGGTSWQTGSTKAFSGNASITVKTKDNAGNISAGKAVSITKIDKTAPSTPTVTGNPTAWTNANVTLTATSTDSASGIAGYSFDGGTTWQTGSTKAFSANASITVKTKDNAGNISAGTAIAITKIDKTAPGIASVTGNAASWTAANVTLTINATDSGGSALKDYSFDGGATWQTSNFKAYAANATIAANYIQARDNAGNITKFATAIAINKIDKTVSTISGISGNPTAWTNANVTLSVVASDGNGSGIKDYSFDGGATWQTSAAKTYTENTNIAAGVIRVRDNVGNIASYATAVAITKIDKIAPTTPTVAGNRDTWGTDDVLLTVTSSDVASGIAGYSFDGGASWQAEKTKSFSANTSITVKVKDNAGNVSAGTAVNITKIDKSAPTIESISGNSAELTDTKTLTINATDTGSGIQDYSFDAGETWQTSNTKTYAANTTIAANTLRVRDNLHQVTNYETVIVIDKINRPNAPEFFENGDYVGAVTKGTNNTLYSELTLQYKIGGGAWQTFTDTSLPIQREMGYAITLRVVDEAGNASAEVPVNLGAYTESVQDMHFDIFNIPLDFSRSYSSKDNQWVFSLISSKVEEGADDSKKVTMPDGLPLYFKLDTSTGVYKNDSTNATLTAAEGGFVLKDGDVSYSYNASGALVQLQYLQYETIAVTRTASEMRFTYHTDTVWTVAFDEDGKPTAISDPNGNSVGYQYIGGHLSKVTNQAGEETSYAYANNRLHQSGDNTICYTENGRIASITGKNGAVQTYSYDETNHKVTISNTAEQTIEYSYNDRLLYTQYKDEQGKVTSYEYDSQGRLTKESNDEGERTYAYDASGNLSKENDTEYAYDAANGQRLWRTKTGAEEEAEYAYYRYANGALTQILTTKQALETPAALETTMADTAGAFYGSLTHIEQYVETHASGLPQKIISANMENGQIITTKDYAENSFVYADNGLQTTKTTLQLDSDGVPTTQTDVRAYVSFYVQETSSTQIGTAPAVASGRIVDLTGKVLQEWTGADTVRFVYDSAGRLVQQIDAAQYDAADDNLFAPSHGYANAGVGVRYTYDENTGNLMLKVNAYDMETVCAYDGYGNLLTQQFHNYTQTYAAWGGLLSTDVGAQNLVSNAYTTDLKHLLASQGYGNGQTISYTYNADGVVTQMQYGTTTAFSYSYGTGDDKEKLLEKTDFLNNVVTKYVTETILDSEDTVEKVRVFDKTSDALLHEYYTQDEKESVTNAEEEEEEKSYSKFGETVAGAQFFAYYKENHDIVPLSANNSLRRDYTKRDDSALLTSSVKLDNGSSQSALISTALTYNSSNLVTSYANTLPGAVSRSYSYSYDSKNNITEIQQNGTIVQSYAYDAWGQLTRENDAQANKTTVYAYDNFGNLLTKTAYAYTTGTDLGEAIAADTYLYENADWADLLTSFNGDEIVYDEIGNPLEYLGWDMTWSAGRQLATASKGDTAISYKYDDNGIRTQKTVGNVTTTY
ncbi:MAG: DNRLRE domain-containing protein, partial [Oscillospiraceae bacterium]|nr:DNRLRE domain-containing protein [Oscillospiraceae bacterium]